MSTRPCNHAASGCDYPAGECGGACAPKQVRTGGAAFAKSDYVHRTCDPNEKVIRGTDGMTMRDYFAAKAMQGICGHVDTWGIPTSDKIAKVAYEMADAMLAARETQS